MSAAGNVRRTTTTRDTWETPPALFDKLNAEFRFTLDAAADEHNRKCERWLGIEENGLTADWLDHAVWCNPPYGSGLIAWVGKFCAASLGGATVVALLPNASDTEWFRTVWATASEIRLLQGRVQFIGTTSSNPSGSIVAVYRPGSYQTGRAPHVSLWNWRP